MSQSMGFFLCSTAATHCDAASASRCAGEQRQPRLRQCLGIAGAQPLLPFHNVKRPRPRHIRKIDLRPRLQLPQSSEMGRVIMGDDDKAHLPCRAAVPARRPFQRGIAPLRRHRQGQAQGRQF